MDDADLRAFARRDWSAAEEAKREYWAEYFRAEGSAPARRASTLLLEHARRLGVPLLNDADRAADCAHHERLCDLLDRAAHVSPVADLLHSALSITTKRDCCWRPMPSRTAGADAIRSTGSNQHRAEIQRHRQLGG